MSFLEHHWEWCCGAVTLEDFHMHPLDKGSQLAYKRQFCDGKKVFSRDYNEYLASVPDELKEEVKSAYWKGFQHGKRLNKNLTKSQCS